MALVHRIHGRSVLVLYRSLVVPKMRLATFIQCEVSSQKN